MDPPLRERLSWRNPIHESAPASPAAIARAGAVFAAAAGLFAFVSVAVPDTAVNDEALLADFFPLPAALAHLALLAVGYATALAAESPSGSVVDGWMATVGTLPATGVFVALVRDRMAGLIANLTDAARRDPLTDLLNRRGFEETFDMSSNARGAPGPRSASWSATSIASSKLTTSSATPRGTTRCGASATPSKPPSAGSTAP